MLGGAHVAGILDAEFGTETLEGVFFLVQREGVVDAYFPADSGWYLHVLHVSVI